MGRGDCVCWLDLPAYAAGNFFRQAAGEVGYGGGFIEHYLLPTLYPHALTREIQVAMSAAVLVLNLIVYAVVWRRQRRAE